MRISRPCYDKYWRCPGWAGPGWGNPRHGEDEECPSGSLSGVIDWDSPWWRWKIHRCPVCGMYVLPYWTHLLDPSYYPGHYGWRIRMWWRYHPWRRTYRRR